MAKKQAPKVEEFQYQAELKQLLHLIIHSLYTDPEVFLRELISNASDALNKARFRMLTDKEVLDPEAKLLVDINIDKDQRTFSIEDSGIGMTRDDLINRIGTVASSGTMEFLRELQANKEQKEKLDGNLIGQFGVGFYSVFMVTDEVVIETRHIEKDSKGYRWQSDGQGSFTIQEIDKPTRGTRISFTFKEDKADFAESFRINHIIKKYSNFVDFPIQVNNETANQVEALWHKPKKDVKDEELNEFYKFISNDFQDPLGHLQLSIEGAVNFKALLFLPASAPPMVLRPEDMTSVQLYSNKVFIQDNAKELIPEYLRFIKGVVDTEDLPLNVSREVTQNSPAMAKIRNTIVSKVLGYLADLMKKEPEKYDTFFDNFAQMLKMGVNSDYSNREKIIDLLKFESTVTDPGKKTSLKNYLSRMNEEQNEIYYLSGESRKSLDRNPNLEYFKKHDLEVLLLSDPVDIFVVPTIGEYEGKKIKSIDKADIEVKDEEASEDRLNENLSNSLIEVFKETLGDKVEDVIESRRLVSSPATLVVGKDGMDAQMEKMMKMMQKDFAGSKRILEINTGHPLIKNLSRLNLGSSTDPLLRQCILQLYEGSLLQNGSLASASEYIDRMNEIMVAATQE